MSFELNTRNIILAILIAGGLLIEALKLLPTNGASSNTVVAQVEDHLFPSTPYSVSQKTIHHTIVEQRRKRAVIAQQTQAAAHFDMKAAITKFNNEQVKVVDEQKKKEEAAKDWHWVYNKKLGQWVWKKKSDKKKEKKEAHETAVAQTPTINPIDEEELKNKSADKDHQTPTLGSATNPPVGGYNNLTAPPTNRFLTQAEWEAKLLKSPSAAETKAFAQAYINHMVTDTVFYAIVDKMLKGNVDLQQQGVLALSMVPAPDSFARLAKESQTVQTSSPLYQPVNAALDAYQQPKNLDELQNVLKQQKDSNVLTIALKQLETSISKNLQGGSSNPSQQGTNAKLFRGFIPVLNTLANNPAVASQARNILNQLGASSNSAVAQF